jgi:ubiquinone/menaquinone biosynthesis C-methylase UbiE
MVADNDGMIREHYRHQAEQFGESSESTMPDVVVRRKEIEAITAFLRWVPSSGRRPRALEVGCGNGFLMQTILQEFSQKYEFHAIDMSPELVEIARKRRLNCTFEVGDIRKTRFDDASYDVVIIERVIINILNPDQQVQAYRELARILHPGGFLVAIEGFKAGLENLNRARLEFLLPPIPEPAVNNWYTEERWRQFLDQGFEELSPEETRTLLPWNFLSSHYFMTRFFHDLIKPEGGKIRNTEFALFFSEALAPVGDYSPLRVKYLRRIDQRQH